MTREFICIMCPQGCDIRAEIDGGSISSVSGNRCQKGQEYVAAEIEHPVRNIATSVLVEGGDSPLASVRLTRPVPKPMVFAVMNEIRRVKVCAPVEEGQTVLRDVLGTGSDVIITRAAAADPVRTKGGMTP